MQENIDKRSFMRILLSIPLRFKITIPYLVIVSVVAGLATYSMGRSFLSTLEERFQGQIEDASFRVADGISTVEEDQLKSNRTISFTLGVPDAVRDDDKEALDRLIFPQIINNDLYFVDILDAAGQPLISWHRIEKSADFERDQFTVYTEWPAVQAVLRGESDDLGDKFAEIVETPWGYSVYTGGPIYVDDELIGVLLVGTPLDELVPELAVKSLANVTVYDPTGSGAITTLGTGVDSLDLDPKVREILLDTTDAPPLQSLELGVREYMEAVENVYLRGEASGWFYGVALPETLVRNTGLPTLLPLLLIFILGILALVALGIAVAQLIAIPIFRLLDASKKVAEGDFDTQVDVYADDEIGMLTQSFNNMVEELNQREYVREMFGRMVSEDVSEAVLAGDLAIGGETKYVSVLFTDVRGFTSLAEKFSPDEVISLLNDFFSIITSATRKYHGVINHFGGDSVLAVFGAPIERSPDESLRQSVLAALDIRRGMTEMNAGRISDGATPLRYGVGINSGWVIAGNVGTEDRFQYTVIGDVVNVAARLQGISRQFPRTPLLIPITGMKALEKEDIFEFQYLGEFRLRGKEKAVPTYGIIGLNSGYPSRFTIFDGFPYHKNEALMACYLFCKGYSSTIIAETLQVSLQTVNGWLTIAFDNQKVVSDILVRNFKLSKEFLWRLDKKGPKQPKVNVDDKSA